MEQCGRSKLMDQSSALPRLPTAWSISAVLTEIFTQWTRRPESRSGSSRHLARDRLPHHQRSPMVSSTLVASMEFFTRSTPVVDKDVVYFGSSDGLLYAIH